MKKIINKMMTLTAMVLCAANLSAQELSTSEDKMADPFEIQVAAKQSDLAFKKYLSDNEIIGKKISITVNTTKVEEAPSYAKGYSYYLSGKFICGYKKDRTGLNLPELSTVMFYCNDENVFNVQPLSMTEATLGKTKESARYNVVGKIKSVKRAPAGGISVIEILE